MSSKTAKKKSPNMIVLPASGPHALQAERIPLEIWLNIIESSDLAPIDVRNLSLTSKFLGWVVQPLLFRSLVITHTRIFTWLPGQPRGQDTAYAARLEARLQFATLARIASGVRSITIAPAPRDDHRGFQVPLGEIIDASVIVDRVFSSLTHFPNLKTLHLTQVTFTPQRVACLASVPLLEGLHLETCPGSGELTLSHFHLRYLSLRGDMGKTVGWWLALLRCPTLEHLAYDTPAAQTQPDDPNEFVFPALATTSVMRSLRTLHLPGASYRFPCFVMALLQCRNVRELFIGDSEKFDSQLPRIAPDREIQLPAEALRQLRAIRAPYEFIMTCVGNRPVKHITTDLTRFLRRPFWDLAFHDFRQRFSELQELAIYASDVSTANVLSLTPPFTRLEALYVNIENSRDGQSAKIILARLEVIQWPRALRSLHVHCQSSDGRRHAARDNINVPILGALVQAREGLHEKDLKNKRMRVLESIQHRCPAIEDIFLSLPGDVTHWKRAYAKPIRWYEWSPHEERKSFL